MCVLSSRFTIVGSQIITNISHFDPLEVVSRYRDPQLQVGEKLNYLI